MTRKTKNTQEQAADEEAKTSAAAEKPEQKPAPKPAKAEAADAASAPDPEGQAEDQGAQTSAAAETPAQETEAAKASAKAVEADAGSPDLGSAEVPEPTGLVVVGPARGRWRAGRHFGAEPVRIPLEELTEDDKAALIADPVLIVSVAEVSRRP